MRKATHAIASRLSGLRALLPGRGGGLRILSYHAVGSVLPHRHDGISVEPARWREQVLSIAPAVALDPALSGIALTFDDGYADFRDVVVPALADLGLPATLFVTVEYAESGSGLYLTRQDVAALARLPNVTVGSHGLSHRRLTECGDAALRLELGESRRILEGWTGSPVTAIAYPHGAVDRRVRDAAEEAGYRIGCTTRFGRNDARTDPLLLRRVEILAADSPRDFRAKVTGAWDWWGVRRIW